MAVYSFLNVQASLTGPGAEGINLGAGAAVAEEGITTEIPTDKNTATWGADGALMHSLHAARPGQISIKLLKTSPMNNVLQAAYNTQSTSAALWGQNIISINDPVRGDKVQITEAAFVKQPGLAFAKEGNTNDWVFIGKISQVLGASTPGLAV